MRRIPTAPRRAASTCLIAMRALRASFSGAVMGSEGAPVTAVADVAFFFTARVDHC